MRTGMERHLALLMKIDRMSTPGNLLMSRFAEASWNVVVWYSLMATASSKTQPEPCWLSPQILP